MSKPKNACKEKAWDKDGQVLGDQDAIESGQAHGGQETLVADKSRPGNLESKAEDQKDIFGINKT